MEEPGLAWGPGSLGEEAVQIETTKSEFIGGLFWFFTF